MGLLRLVGASLLALGCMCLVFACSPANVADAPALIEATWKCGGLGAALLLLAHLVARRAEGD